MLLTLEIKKNVCSLAGSFIGRDGFECNAEDGRPIVGIAFEREYSVIFHMRIVFCDLFTKSLKKDEFYFSPCTRVKSGTFHTCVIKIYVCKRNYHSDCLAKWSILHGDKKRYIVIF